MILQLNFFINCYDLAVYEHDISFQTLTPSLLFTLITRTTSFSFAVSHFHLLEYSVFNRFIISTPDYEFIRQIVKNFIVFLYLSYDYVYLLMTFSPHLFTF